MALKPTATTPSTHTAVDDVLPPPVLHTDASASRPSQKKAAGFKRLTVHWESLKKRMGTVTASPSSSMHGDRTAQSYSSHQKTVQVTGDDEKVDEIVVDRVWSEGIISSSAPSEHGASPDKSGASHLNTTSTDQGSLFSPSGFWTSFPLLVAFQWKIWPTVMNFFSTRFSDQTSELRYRQESWSVQKVNGLLFSYPFL
jgi:osomolarity two-component system sensor histidine kinase SLN1